MMTTLAGFLVESMGDGTERVRLDRLTGGRIMCQLCFDHFTVDQLNPVDGGFEDICRRCGSEERLRSYVTTTDGARRFHKTATCKALLSAQDLSDWDCWDLEYCHHQHPKPNPIREITLADAVGAGKWPCAVCWPGYAAALAISSSEDDFGHQPVEVWGEPCCTRCSDHGIDEYGDPWLHPTIWPCTSAIVLGLAPREVS